MTPSRRCGCRWRPPLAPSAWRSYLACRWPGSWALARPASSAPRRFPGRAVIRALVTLPMVLPPVVGGIALLYAFGRRGFAGRWLYAATGWRLPFTAGGAIVAEGLLGLAVLV